MGLITAKIIKDIQNPENLQFYGLDSSGNPYVKKLSQAEYSQLKNLGLQEDQTSGTVFQGQQIGSLTELQQLAGTTPQYGWEERSTGFKNLFSGANFATLLTTGATFVTPEQAAQAQAGAYGGAAGLGVTLATQGKPPLQQVTPSGIQPQTLATQTGTTAFRPRNPGEDMTVYLQAKQAHEIAQTGQSGIVLPQTAGGTDLRSQAIAGLKALGYGSPDEGEIQGYIKDFLSGGTQPTLESIQAGIARVAGQIPGIQAGVQALTTPPIVPPEEISPTEPIAPPALPGVPDYTGYFTSLMTELANSRTTLEKAYQDQITSLQQQQATSQAKIDAFISKSEATLEEVKTLTQPWQADLEKAERSRLKVEENYFANQNSVKELENLLTQAMSDIQSAESVTGLAAIRTPRITQIKTEYQARASVIEAVMAARNNQISVANNLIDRNVVAITNDKNAQLTYYNAVLGFYDKLRDEEGNKLITLTTEETKYVDAQISLLQNDLAQAQTTVNYVKQLMIDPNTAQVIESAGVTLNDSVAQINAKLAAYAYTKEVQDTSNTMSKGGYTYLLPQQVASKPANEVVTMTDSKGNKTYWWKAVTPITTGTSIDYYANKVLSGELNLSTVPADIRNQVVSKVSELEKQPVTIPAPPDYVASFKAYKDAGWTREQVESSWIAQYNTGKVAAMQLKDKNEMYKSFPEIKASLDEVYGKAPGIIEKVTTWWENLWK